MVSDPGTTLSAAELEEWNGFAPKAQGDNP